MTGRDLARWSAQLPLLVACVSMCMHGCYRSHTREFDAGADVPPPIDAALSRDDGEVNWADGATDGSVTSCPTDIGGTWVMTDALRDRTWTLEFDDSGFPTSAEDASCSGRWCNADNCVVLHPSPPACEAVSRARLACASTREDSWSGVTYRFESSTRMTMIWDHGAAGIPPDIFEGRR